MDSPTSLHVMDEESNAQHFHFSSMKVQQDRSEQNVQIHNVPSPQHMERKSRHRESILQAQTKVNNQHKQQQSFLKQAFDGIDMVLSAFSQLTTDDHPLDKVLLETALLTREVLSCWSTARVHDIALDSMILRYQAVGRFLAQEKQQRKPRLEGWIDKMGKHRGWTPRILSWKLNHVNSLFKSNKAIKQLDLYSVQTVQDVHTGKEALFNIAVRPPAEPEKIVQYRAPNDAEKQRWMSCFQLYVTKNHFKRILDNVHPREQASVLQKCVLLPYEPNAKMFNHFLFMTNDTRAEATSRHKALRAEEGVRGLTYGEALTTIAEERRAEDMAVQSAIKNDQFGVVERFEVLWPQKVGKPKVREIEVCLGRPHTISFFKPKRAGLEKKEIGNDPDSVYKRHHLIDYRLREDKLQIELLFGPTDRERFTMSDHQMKMRERDVKMLEDKASSLSSTLLSHEEISAVTRPRATSSMSGLAHKNSSSSMMITRATSLPIVSESEEKSNQVGVMHKKFIFLSEESMLQFIDLLKIFQQPPEDLRFEFIHRDILHIMRHHKPDTQDIEEEMTRSNNSSNSPLPVIMENDKSTTSNRRSSFLQMTSLTRAVSDSGVGALKEAAKDDDSEEEVEAKEDALSVPQKRKHLRQRSRMTDLNLIVPSADIAQTQTTINELAMARGQLHMLFMLMLSYSPEHQLLQKLVTASAATPFNPDGDASRLRMLCVMMYEFEDDTKSCLCPTFAPVGSSSTQKRVLKEQQTEHLNQSGRRNCPFLVVRAFQQAQGLSDIHRYLETSNHEQLRAWGIRLVWRVFQLKALLRHCTGALHPDRSGYSAPYENKPFYSFVNVTGRNAKLGRDALNVLFEILVNESKRGVLKDADKDSITTVEVMNKRIEKNVLIPFVMYALSRATEESALIGLQNIVLLLKDSNNALLFLNRSGWYSWFFPLLTTPLREALDGDPDFASSKAFALSLTTITSLQYMYLTLMEDQEQLENNVKFSWKSRESQVVRSHMLFQNIERFVSYGGLSKSTAQVISLLFVSLFSLLMARARSFSHNFDFENPFVWQSLISITLAAEEYLFWTPFATSILSIFHNCCMSVYL